MPDPTPDQPPDPPPSTRPGCLLDGPWIRDDWAQEAFAIQQRDTLGSRVHLVCALIACVGITGPISVAEWSVAPVLLCAVARTTVVWRLWWHLILQPAMLATSALVVFGAIALAWSPDPSSGLAELAEFRWVLIVFALWPMMQRRQLLVAAYTLGFLATHLGQGYQLLVQSQGLDWPVWDRLPERISAWWSPVAGGTALAGALGLHLAGLVWGSGRWRLIALAGTLITALGIVATGTRGAWLAGAGLGAIAGLIALTRSLRQTRDLRPRWRTLTAAGVGIAAIAGLAWALLGASISARISEARSEIARAADAGDLDSNLGGRLIMWEQARDAILAHPIRGVGLGGYHDWAAQRLADQPALARRIHDHAHSTPIHVASELGLVGLGLFALVIVSALWAGFRRWQPGPTGYGWAPPVALLGLMLAGLFQTVLFTSHDAAQLWLLIALCPAWHPAQLAWRTDRH